MKFQPTPYHISAMEPESMNVPELLGVMRAILADLSKVRPKVSDWPKVLEQATFNAGFPITLAEDLLDKGRSPLTLTVGELNRGIRFLRECWYWSKIDIQGTARKG